MKHIKIAYLAKVFKVRLMFIFAMVMNVFCHLGHLQVVMSIVAVLVVRMVMAVKAEHDRKDVKESVSQHGRSGEADEKVVNVLIAARSTFFGV